MYISKINENEIQFNNGSIISFDHVPDCCEYNYADFQQLDDEARNYNYSTEIKFEAVDGSGFRFGDNNRMFFVPCYSEQNGYYSSDIDIYFNGEKVCDLSCEDRYDC